MNPTNQDFQTVIGSDANFKGELSFDSAAKLLGRFEGSINAKGKLFVADGANCKASVTARDIVLEGQVQGNIQAAERVELKPTARITGDITAAKMTMADGASIDGHMKIGGKIDAATGSRPAATATTTEIKPAAQPQAAPVAVKR